MSASVVLHDLACIRAIQAECAGGTPLPENHIMNPPTWLHCAWPMNL